MLGCPRIWVPDRRVVAAPGGGGTQDIATNLLAWGPQTGKAWPVGTSAFRNNDLNDANNAVATVFVIPRTGTIDRVGFRCNSVTGNPPAYNVGIVTVDNSGNPTTTGYGGSATTTYDFTGAGWVWITLGTPASAVAGQIAAVRVWPTGSAPDGTNFAAISYDFTSSGGVLPKLPLGRYFTTLWITGLGFSAAAMYDDGSVALPAITGLVTAAFGSASTPDEIGCLFSLPFDANCVGAQVQVDPSLATADFTVKLYGPDGSTLLGSNSIDTSTTIMAGAANVLSVFWPAVSLNANDLYRLTVLPTSTGTLLLGEVTVNEAASRAWWPEGVRWQRTSRADAGAWTEDPTKLTIMAAILSQITVPQ